jgi:hypothetical protein
MSGRRGVFALLHCAYAATHLSVRAGDDVSSLPAREREHVWMPMRRHEMPIGAQADITGVAPDRRHRSYFFQRAGMGVDADAAA